MSDIQQAVWCDTPEIKRKTTGINYLKEIHNLVENKKNVRKRWQKSKGKIKTN